MKLKIVNEQEKNIVYLVTDTTEKFNLPRLSENQILLAGNWPAKLIQYDKEKLKKVLKENGFHYNIYIGRVNLNDVLLEDDVRQIEDDQIYDCVETLLDWFNAHSIVKVGSSIYDNVLSSYHNAFFEDSYIDVNGIHFIDIFDSGYTRQEMDVTIDALDKLTNQIIELTGYVENTYLLCSDFDYPEFVEIKTISDLSIPEIPDLSANLILDDSFLLEQIKTYKDDLLSSSLYSAIDERVRKTDILSAKIDELQAIKRLRSWAKISFSPYEPFYREWIRIDGAYVNGEKVSCTITEEGGKITYHIQGIYSNLYELRLKKTGYIDVVFDMQTQITENVNQMDEFYLGNINMLAKDQQLKFIFTWGEYPLDLDTHVYCFTDDFKNEEHAYFLKLRSEKSKIDIDVDDVTSYGPETTHIFKPDMSKFYLLTIHNYSRYVKRLEDNEDMDPEKLVNVKVQLYDFELNIKPIVNLFDKYWWDVLIVHDNKVYVLDTAPDDRTVDYSHELNVFAKRKIFQLIKECKEIHDISRYKPTVIRWY